MKDNTTGCAVICSSITQDIIHNYPIGIFDEFYSDYLAEYEIKLYDAVSALETPFELSADEIVRRALFTQRESLMKMASRTLLSEMYRMKEEGELPETDPEQEYKDYIKIITENEYKKFFRKKFSVLEKLIRQKIETSASLIIECITYLSEDAEKIYREMGVYVSKVNAILPDSGDTHNNGKSVASVVINDGERIFYKPHALDGDEFFRNFAKEFVKNDEFVNGLVKFVNCPDHGWQECVQYSEAANEKEARTYYRNIGNYIAIFYMLGTEDMHFENIIASGSSPKFIDLETVLANKNNDSMTHTETLLGNMMADIKQSVYSSLIIPQNYEFTIFDIDMSGLTGGMDSSESQNLSYFAISNPFTSDLKYEKKFSYIPESNNLLKMNGKIINAGDYIDDILHGFEDAYKKICGSKEKIVYWLKHKTDQKAEFRQILRATYMYAKFIESSYHPKYLQEESERDRLFSILYGKTELPEKRKKVIDIEKQIMLNNDIPCFQTNINSRDLIYEYNGEKHIIKDNYSSTIFDRIKEKLAVFSEKDMKKQENYIRASLANYTGKTADTLDKQNTYLADYLAEIPDDLPEKERYLRTAEAIAMSIDKNKIMNNVRDSCALFEITQSDKDKELVGYLKPDLYNGLGTLLFIGLTAHAAGNKELEHFMYQLDRGFEELYPFDVIRSQYTNSAFTGLTSYIYVYSILSRYYDSDLFRQRYEKALQAVLETAPSEVDKLDVIEGIAGIIPVMCEVYRSDGQRKDVYDHITALSDRMEELITDNKMDLAGFAHGYSGVIYAYTEAYKITNNTRYLKKVIDLTEIENTYYSDKYNNWRDARQSGDSYGMLYWCHGAGGIALSRKAAAAIPDITDEQRSAMLRDASVFLDTVICGSSTIKVRNHCMCHGLTGNINILNSLKEVFPDKHREIEEYTGRTIKELLDNVQKDGFNYQYRSNLESKGLMLGLSGIGYSILRLYDSKLPDVLSLKMERRDGL